MIPRIRTPGESLAHTVRAVMRARGVHNPRIICWDIETAPNLLTGHNLFETRPLPPSAIKRERYLICAAWKQLGKPVQHVCVSPRRPHDDRPVVLALCEMLTNADAIVHHYGNRFDARMLRARALALGIPPPPPVVQIDTYNIAKRHFRLNSNRLDYLGKLLGVGRKIKTTGELWDRCMDGDAEALKAMVRYNRQDVRLLERVFLRLRPWMTEHGNLFVPKIRQGVGKHCPRCGGRHVIAQGLKITRSGARKQWQCQSPACGAWHSTPVKTQANNETKRTVSVLRRGNRMDRQRRD